MIVSTGKIGYQMWYVVDVWQDSQNIPENYTTIGWSVSLKGTHSNNYAVDNKGYSNLYINGSKVWSRGKGTFKAGEYARGKHILYHDSDGRKTATFNFSSRILSSTSTGTKSFSLTTIPRKANLLSAPSFNDEMDVTIKYKNILGNRATELWTCIVLNDLSHQDNGENRIKYREVNKTGSSYTYKFTEEEKQKLYSELGPSRKSMPVWFYLSTKIGGKWYFSTIKKTFTLVNANPIFTSDNITVTETNANIKNFITTKDTYVQNNSILKIDISDALPQKNTSVLPSYTIQIGNKTYTDQKANTPNIISKIDLSGTVDLKVTATDKRGNKTTVTKKIKFLEYKEPTAVIEMVRKNNYEDETKLNVDASFSSLNNKNKLNIYYKKKKVGYSIYYDPVEIENNTNTIFFNSKEASWDIVVILKDKISTVEIPLVLPKGKFIFFIDTKKLSVGINCFPTREETLEVNGYKVITENELGQYEIIKEKINNGFTEYDSVDFPKDISLYNNGIILVWRHKSGEFGYSHTYIPKFQAIAHDGAGVHCYLGDASGTDFCTKYVYVYKNKIQGYKNNNSGKAGNYILETVIGY